MIINHSKKFIFFTNRKTTSTSTAIALSSSCNRNDIVTLLGRDEKISRQLSCQGPTNFIPWWNKINYFRIEAKSKIFQKARIEPLRQLIYLHILKQKPSLTRITSVHVHSTAITAFVSFEIHGAGLFPSFLNLKKQENAISRTRYIHRRRDA